MSRRAPFALLRQLALLLVAVSVAACDSGVVPPGEGSPVPEPPPGEEPPPEEDPPPENDVVLEGLELPLATFHRVKGTRSDGAATYVYDWYPADSLPWMREMVPRNPPEERFRYIEFTGGGSLAFMAGGRFRMRIEVHYIECLPDASGCSTADASHTIEHEGTYHRWHHLVRLSLDGGGAMAATVGREADGAPIVTIRTITPDQLGAAPAVTSRIRIHAVAFTNGLGAPALGPSPTGPPPAHDSEWRYESVTWRDRGRDEQARMNTDNQARYFFRGGFFRLSGGQFTLGAQLYKEFHSGGELLRYECTATGPYVLGAGVLHLLPGTEHERYAVIDGDEVQVDLSFLALEQCAHGDAFSLQGHYRQ